MQPLKDHKLGLRVVCTITNYVTDVAELYEKGKSIKYEFPPNGRDRKRVTSNE